jgi:hypothetical protein
MSAEPRMPTRATGRCLCGAVAFEVHGPLRDVIVCHCEECRRWSGYLGAFTAAKVDDLVLRSDGALRWIDSPQSDTNARRGFCAACGSSLFWQPPGDAHVRIAVGALDRPTGLLVGGHGYVEAAGDWDELAEDGLQRGTHAPRGLRWS